MYTYQKWDNCTFLGEIAMEWCTIRVASNPGFPVWCVFLQSYETKSGTESLFEATIKVLYGGWAEYCSFTHNHLVGQINLLLFHCVYGRCNYDAYINKHYIFCPNFNLSSILLHSHSYYSIVIQIWALKVRKGTAPYLQKKKKKNSML